jgi:N-acetyl-gamma-glutamyl-phosphate reductase
MRMDVALFGAAGYSGMELLKLLARHPHARVVAAASDTLAGKTSGATTFVTTAHALATTCDLALLAVPPEPAKQLAEQLLAKGARVVDLSHAHRGTHPYGLTSLFPDVASAQLVANPGCYATCAITALAPLVKLDIVDGIYAVSAGSGVTGAGRSASEEMSLGEMYGEVRAYKVLRHQHVPEIEAALARVGNAKPVVLTTHLLPIARGIFMTITAKLARRAGVLGEYRAMFANDPTVVIADSAEDVSLRKVVGTATCMVGVATNDDVVVVTAALDNLLKGAASQAIENMNLMFGYPRMAGLEHLARHA